MRRIIALAACIALVPAVALAAVPPPPPVPSTPTMLQPVTLGNTAVVVPIGTKVPLRFLTEVDSATVKQGTAVKFEVAADVLINRDVVFRMGTPAQGVVTDVSPPGIFGKNAKVHIAYIQAPATDGRPAGLSPLDVTPQTVTQVKDVGAAAGTAVAGAILLGPIGIAAGALWHGGQVTVPIGAVGTTDVAEQLQVYVP